MTELHQQQQESVRELENIWQSIEYASQLSILLEEKEETLKELEKILKKEQRDVHVIQDGSVTGWIREIIGDREEKLEKEQEEYLQVSQRHIELHKSIELTRYELGILKQKEASLEILEKRMEILLAEREKELIASDQVTSTLLKSLDDQRTQHNNDLKKIEKLITTGNTTLTLVTSIENHLNEAHAQLVSNKAGSALLVDGALVNSRRPLQKTNQLLIRFEKEVTAIFPDTHLETKIQFEAFGSYSRPDFISNLTFKEKIKISRKSVREIKQQLEIILGYSDQQHVETLDKIAAVEEERKKLILGSK